MCTYPSLSADSAAPPHSTPTSQRRQAPSGTFSGRQKVVLRSSCRRSFSRASLCEVDTKLPPVPQNALLVLEILTWLKVTTWSITVVCHCYCTLGEWPRVRLCCLSTHCLACYTMACWLSKLLQLLCLFHALAWPSTGACPTANIHGGNTRVFFLIYLPTAGTHPCSAGTVSTRSLPKLDESFSLDGPCSLIFI